MFEVYVLVEKKKSVFLTFFSVFSYVMAVLSAIFVMIGLYFFVPTAVFGFILGWFFQTRNYEFEYSYFDGDVRFAKIINKANRKKLPGYKMSEVLAIAPTGDASVASYENDSKAKLEDYSRAIQEESFLLWLQRVKKELNLCILNQMINTLMQSV